MGLKNFKKLKELFEGYKKKDGEKTLEELFLEKENEEEQVKEEKYKYRINKLDAFLIACKDCNLKSDYTKTDNRRITFITFNNYKIKLIHHKDQPYWFIKITDGDISWFDEDTMYDGFFDENDLKKLQCYINANTGEYFYYEDLK